MRSNSNVHVLFSARNILFPQYPFYVPHSMAEKKEAASGGLAFQRQWLYAMASSSGRTSSP